MKWKSKFVHTDPEPGTTRLKRVFAWRPTYVHGEIVWLAYFEILQSFVIFEYKIIIDGELKAAKVTQWTDIDKRLIS